MKSLLFRTYSFVFLNDFVLIYPLYAVMFTDHGLSASDVAIIIAVWSATVFVLEVPAGALADKVSRRHLMALGQVLRAGGYLLWLLFPHFWGYLFGIMLWGLKSALTHGTLEAWFYDELKARGEATRYAKCYSHMRAISFAAILAASGGASLGILVGYNLLLLFSVASGLAAALVAIFLPAAPRSKEDEETGTYFQLLGQGFKSVAADPILLRLLIFMAFVGGMLGTMDEFWPILARLSGAPLWAIPVFVAVLSTVQALAAFQGWRFENWSERTFYMAVVLSGIGIAVAGLGLNLYVLPLVLFAGALDALVRVVFDARLQHRIGSETRATISSIKGLMLEVFGLLALGVFGVVSRRYGDTASFAIMGALIALGGLDWWLRSILQRKTDEAKD